ncbi:DUF6279 family lipoprotein [Bdellovibrio sp. SKB1291214]|uniref:DUF6279 family lipoprotein n=1 Tax=Bdellovibrio sp. SKB1291214 TaxID=1732569 RepID=UPI000B51A110|nr:DUF6279 family lipoprotein [Bdellovibrio sp. SKB1291214]UYL08029.1 DUF6279 family lipoprotein [Bdellovibrio sp. SKB1291214]
MKNILLVLSLGVLFLSGCSRLDIAYRWADTYIASKVDDYFDISSDQSKALKKDIKKDLGVMKTTLLPQWTDRLQKIQNDVEAGTLNDSKVAFYFSQFFKDIEQINSHFATTAVEFISTTQPTQIEYFKKSFAKKNREDIEKAQNIAKAQKEYRGKYEDIFEMFVGSLTKDQEKMIAESVKNFPYPAELKARNKAYIFNEFISHQNSMEEMKKFVRDYTLQAEKFDLPEFRAANQAYQENLQKLITQVMTQLTEKQKVALKNNIHEKTEQLRAISAIM